VFEARTATIGSRAAQQPEIPNSGNGKWKTDRWVFRQVIGCVAEAELGPQRGERLGARLDAAEAVGGGLGQGRP